MNALGFICFLKVKLNIGGNAMFGLINQEFEHFTVKAFDPIDSVLDDITYSFRNFLNASNLKMLKTRSKFPKIDVYESDDKLFVDIVVAGYNDDDYEIKFDTKNQSLIISSNIEKNKKEQVKYLLNEIKKSNFYREIKFSREYFGELKDPQIKESRDGVVTVIFSKDKEDKDNYIKKLK